MVQAKNKVTKDTLKELCVAHAELQKTKKAQLQKTDSSTVLIKQFDEMINKVRKQIAEKLTAWLGIKTAE